MCVFGEPQLLYLLSALKRYLDRRTQEESWFVNTKDKNVKFAQCLSLFCIWRYFWWAGGRGSTCMIHIGRHI
jgi:hypothetical protein